jgi:DNA polymerase I-like protein with 3'-5' exonuclease and polymerase domains
MRLHLRALVHDGATIKDGLQIVKAGKVDSAPVEDPCLDEGGVVAVGSVGSPITFDTETALIRPGCQAPPLVCMSYDDGGVRLVGHEEAPRLMHGFLASGRLLVGHNVAYDFGVLAAEDPLLLPAIFQAYEDGRVADTMIRQKLIDIAEGQYRGFLRADGKLVKVKYGLADLCLRHLEVELPKTEIRLQYGALRGVPLAEWPELAREYALSDAAITALVYEAQSEARWVRYLNDQYRQTAAAWWLWLMSTWGLRTDAEGVKRFAEELQGEFDEIAERLKAAGMIRADGTRDTKAVKAHLSRVMMRQGKQIALTPKGGVMLSADVCEATEDELLVKYARLSSLKKQLSTDIPLLQQGAVMPIHPYFESLAETGRTTSSPNVQNLPVYGKMRECFVPRAGMVFASADFDGFELRTMAQVCVSRFGTSRLAEALNAGLDPHLVVASKILGITYDEAKVRHAAGDDEVYRARQTGKVASFGFPGGLGFERLSVWAKKSYDTDVTPDEAKVLKENWFSAWPEFRTFFSRISDLCETPNPQLVQLFSNRFRGDVTYTEAANSEFQGLASDCAKIAGFLVSKACYVETTSPLFGSRIVNFVHDEFIVEAPEAKAPEAAEELARLMVLGAGKFLPDVPPKASPLLMRRWSKKAKAIRGADGRLVPWQ